MQLIIDLAGAEGLAAAAADLERWYAQHGLSSSGAWVLVGAGGSRFGWRITGLEVVRNVSETPAPELMAAIRAETADVPPSA